MSHLGDRIAALVDGELSHDARDRVLTHIAQCIDCRSRADVERRTKGRLAGLRGPDPAPGLSVRLLAIAEPGPPIPPERRPLPGARRPTRPTAAPPGRPGDRFVSLVAHRPHPGSRGGRRVRAATVGTLSLALIALSTAFVVGARPAEHGRLLTPPVDRYAVEHAATAGDMPLSDPAFGAVTGSLSQQLRRTVPFPGQMSPLRSPVMSPFGGSRPFTELEEPPTLTSGAASR